MNDGGFTAYSGLSARIPPEHTRMRAIVQKEFTPRRYKKLEPTIRENTSRLLHQMLAHADARGDFLKDVAVDIPTITILGCSASVRRWSRPTRNGRIPAPR